MKFILFLLIIIMFFTISCKKDDGSPTAPPTQPTDVLVPLKVGNSWTFNAKEYSRNGVAIDSGTASMSVVHDTVLNNVKWFDLGTGLRVTNKSDGYWMRDDHNNEFLFYRFPVAEGVLYKIAEDVNGILQSSHDTITVPHGTHVCYKYHITQRPPYGNKTIIDMYIQPNIGMIRQDIFDDAGFVQYIYLLTAYTLLE